MAKVTLPQFPITGGCQCGAIRFSLNAPPVVFYLCHCTKCQKQSSSAFGESVRVRPEDIRIEGTPSRFESLGSKGLMRCEFCPQCGTRLFHIRPGSFNLKGGSLDDATWLRPAGHIWTSSKQGFICIGEDELSYTHQPDTYEALTLRWQDMIGTAPRPLEVT